MHLDKIDSSTSNLCYRFRLCVVTQEDSVDAFPRMRKKETRDISDIIEHRMKVLNITGTRKLRRIQSEGGGWGNLMVSLSGLGQFVKGLLTF